MRICTVLFFLLTCFIGSLYAQPQAGASDELILFPSEGFSMARPAPTPDSLQGWSVDGLINITLSQVSLTNWNAGGQGVVSANSLFKLNVIHRGEISIFENNLSLAYGLQKFEKDGLRKSDDRIELVSKYGAEAFGDWYYTGLLNFRTQFQAGFNYPNDSVEISTFMAPGYLIASLGLENKSIEGLSVLISPVTAKFTFVNDPILSAAAAFGVDSNKTVRTEIGGALRATYTKQFKENVKFSSSLELFSNYMEDPQNIDVAWENLLSFKVTKLITATINTNLIYDNDIIFNIDNDEDGVIDETGPRTQYKQVIGVGLQYSF